MLNNQTKTIVRVIGYTEIMKGSVGCTLSLLLMLQFWSKDDPLFGVILCPSILILLSGIGILRLREQSRKRALFVNLFYAALLTMPLVKIIMGGSIDSRILLFIVLLIVILTLLCVPPLVLTKREFKVLFAKDTSPTFKGFQILSVLIFIGGIYWTDYLGRENYSIRTHSDLKISPCSNVWAAYINLENIARSAKEYHAGKGTYKTDLTRLMTGIYDLSVDIKLGFYFYNYRATEKGDKYLAAANKKPTINYPVVSFCVTEDEKIRFDQSGQNIQTYEQCQRLPIINLDEVAALYRQ